MAREHVGFIEHGGRGKILEELMEDTSAWEGEDVLMETIKTLDSN